MGQDHVPYRFLLVAIGLALFFGSVAYAVALL
jgi:hypothetical protein